MFMYENDKVWKNGILFMAKFNTEMTNDTCYIVIEGPCYVSTHF